MPSVSRAVGSVVFFFNDPATTEIYTLSLHDALPISRSRNRKRTTGALPGLLNEDVDAFFVRENDVGAFVAVEIDHLKLRADTRIAAGGNFMRDECWRRSLDRKSVV